MKALILVTLYALAIAGCPSADKLRSDRVKSAFNTAVNEGLFYEVAFKDVAQFKSWKCQQFVRKPDSTGSFTEDFLYQQSGKTTKFEMVYEKTDQPGVYLSHPVFEKLAKIPATVIDHAEDGSWTVLYKCMSAGPITLLESFEIMSRRPQLTATEQVEINKSLERAGFKDLALTQVDHSACVYNQ